jgi:hypothetical protein
MARAKSWIVDFVMRPSLGGARRADAYMWYTTSEKNIPPQQNKFFFIFGFEAGKSQPIGEFDHD